MYIWVYLLAQNISISVFVRDTLIHVLAVTFMWHAMQCITPLHKAYKHVRWVFDVSLFSTTRPRVQTPGCTRWLWITRLRSTLKFSSHPSSQEPLGPSPSSPCLGGLAMAPWGNPSSCWPTASRWRSPRWMSTSTRWTSSLTSVRAESTGKTGQNFLLLVSSRGLSVGLLDPH